MFKEMAVADSSVQSRDYNENSTTARILVPLPSHFPEQVFPFARTKFSDLID